jgi:unsaturated rhamnogalacturonyl hydrolase
MKYSKRLLLSHGVIIFLSSVLMLSSANAQKKVAVANDVTTPLHAMQPDYPVPYKAMPQREIKSWLDKVFNYLDVVTPARMINKKTGQEVTDIEKLDTNTIIEQKDFRLTSYEWGVTYSAMMRAAETTGDKKYVDYVKKRFDFLAKWIPAVKEKFPLDYIRRKNLFVQPISPHALDDAGAVCAAMIKATVNGSQSSTFD